MKFKEKTSWKNCNRLLDTVVTIVNYRKRTFDHDVYIKAFFYVTVYYLTVCTDDVIKNINDEKVTELTRVFEEPFEIKFQEGYVLKYQNFLICRSSLGFSFD